MRTIGLYALCIAVAASCGNGDGDGAGSEGDGTDGLNEAAAEGIEPGETRGRPIPGTETLPGRMVRVPGGVLEMGTDSAELPAIMERTGLHRVEMFVGELPRHDVRVASFLLDSTDVTNADFLAFVRANPAWARDSLPAERHNGRYLEHWADGRPAPGDEDLPVTFVTWQAAVAYCDWRRARLPTEAEWEWASAGGVPDAEYPWGSDPPSDARVNWSGDGIDRPVPVASYPANGYGLYDMSGNVWKFLANEASDYRDVADHRVRIDPDTAERVETRRAVRGGSFGAAAANLRVRYRDSHRPRDAREMVGFRCAADAA